MIAYNMQFISAAHHSQTKSTRLPRRAASPDSWWSAPKFRTDPQVKKLIKAFFDPRVQPYLRTTTNPRLADRLTPVAGS
jgi:hypothetical protein